MNSFVMRVVGRHGKQDVRALLEWNDEKWRGLFIIDSQIDPGVSVPNVDA